jgi:hypothetical protein
MTGNPARPIYVPCYKLHRATRHLSRLTHHHLLRAERAASLFPKCPRSMSPTDAASERYHFISPPHFGQGGGLPSSGFAPGDMAHSRSARQVCQRLWVARGAILRRGIFCSANLIAAASPVLHPLLMLSQITVVIGDLLVHVLSTQTRAVLAEASACSAWRR